MKFCRWHERQPILLTGYGQSAVLWLSVLLLASDIAYFGLLLSNLVCDQAQAASCQHSMSIFSAVVGAVILMISSRTFHSLSLELYGVEQIRASMALALGAYT